MMAYKVAFVKRNHAAGCVFGRIKYNAKRNGTRIRRMLRIAIFGGPTLVGKILDKSRPPELRWRYPKPQLFPENSIENWLEK